MNLTPPKLRPLHIGIITAVLALIIGGAMANFWIMPIMKDNQAKQAVVTQLEDEGSVANQMAANLKLKNAVAKALATRVQWAAQEAKYFRVGPNKRVLDLSDIETAQESLSEEQNLLLTGILVRWLSSTGNRVLVPPTVDAKGPNPNDIAQDVIRVGAKGIKIQGTFKSVMNFLRATAKAPRLVTIDSVSLSSIGGDTSGGTVDPLAFMSTDTVIADLDLTVYIYPRGKLRPLALPGGDTTGGGAAGPAGPYAGPSMPGGPQMPGGPPRGPSGMPGGPPMMP